VAALWIVFQAAADRIEAGGDRIEAGTKPADGD
jgi:hypothetical protein